MTRIFRDDGGVAYVIGQPVRWQIGSAGLKPGAVYLVANRPVTGNTYSIGIVPGVIPSPAAAAVLLSVTPPELLRLGGGNLPLSKTGEGLKADQLFNDGGLLCVASGKT
jgi:hypothetical protein